MNDTKESYKNLIAQTDELVKAHFAEKFGNNQFMESDLSSISEVWMKGQALKKDAMIENGGQPCIHYGELFTKYGPFIDTVFSKTDIEIKRSSYYGDILFPASDVTPDGLTKCSAILLTGVLLGGDIIVMRPKKGLNSVYLSYAIRMQKEQLLSRVTGSVVRHISAKSLQTVKIPIPPKDMQDSFESLLRQADKSKSELKQALAELNAAYKRIIEENLC